ncbi:cyclic-di-AMP-binding protein CbpB [Streptococcus ovuberis]|uniref:CBS domain-containing protein n=1 Tax=Streptococcus ovuberis TaxID=1936207 RepID=A0A7X6S017_9STRE|nr:cyclic-di-AMP-binding protein CbpB [Streptococcus ovuberis]NKZ19743.1 CBS domain-containing protein [Streptococcus ovuberis]
MIHPLFKEFLRSHEETFLTPAENLAVLIDTHNMDHAKLLLSHMTYSRVPVVTQEGKFVGTIGLTEIIRYQVEHGLTEEQLNRDICSIVKTDVRYVSDFYSLTQVMSELIEQSFLPVVDKDGYFKGIITRKAILKAINSLLHHFGQSHEIEEKDDSH